MIKKFKIGKMNATVVTRHRWDTNRKFHPEFREYRLGLHFDRKKIVGANDFNDPKKWDKNLVKDYTIGIDLIIFKARVRFHFGQITFL